MPRSRWLKIFVPCLLAALAAPLLPSAPARAEPPDPAKLHYSVLGDPAWEGGDPDRPLIALVQLEGPSTLDLYLGTGRAVGDPAPEARRALDRIVDTVAKRQAPLRAGVEAAGARIISTYDAAMNGFLVQATRAQLEAITGLAGVRRVFRAPTFYPMLSNAVPTIGANRVIEGLGVTGKGVNVAIIDTGIDYNHGSLGGSGRQRDYQNNNAGIVEIDSFPTGKVVGGWDFVGGGYTGGNVPAPDPDPLDEAGHGTHVAGISAGTSGSPQVFHGVAPEANLVALKVFGRRGGTNVASDAIDWAVRANQGRPVEGFRARVDVINMSLGASWAWNVDSDLGITRSATNAGIVLIASAGNSGNAAFVTGAPAAASHAISVASTFASGQRTDKVVANHSGRSEDLEAVEADPSLTAQIFSLTEVRGDLTWFGSGCNADAPHPPVEGKIALITYGGCNEFEKLDNAGRFGFARGAIVYNPAGGLTTLGVDWKEAPATIPAFMIQGADGERLRQLVEGGTAVEIVMAAAYKGAIERDRLADVISPFSSRGPSRGGQFKPDLAAPGSNINAPAMGSGDQPVSLSGTSMASPVVAGVAALLVERLRRDGWIPADRPMSPAEGLSAVEVGAMLVNYAGSTVWEASNGSQPVPLARGGSGRVDAYRTVHGDTIVTAGDIASFNFGIDAFDQVYTDDRPFSIRNLSNAPKRYRISTEFMDPVDRDAGVRFTPEYDDITVEGRAAQPLLLELEVDPAGLKPFTASGGDRAMVPGRGLNAAEYDAHLVVTEIDGDGNPVPEGDVARVPIYILPRAASALAVSPAPLRVNPISNTGPGTVGNPGLGDGTAELFALLAEDEPEEFIDRRLNVELVGARVTPGENGARTLEFAIRTRGPRLTPFDSRARVFVDTNRDGTMDWMVYNDDLDYLLTGGRRASGEQWNVLRRVAGQSPFVFTNVINLQAGYARYAYVNLQSRVIILRADARTLGFADGAPIAFEALVAHDTFFEDVRGAPRNDAFDSVPGGAVGVANGSLAVVGPGRLRFDEATLGFGLDRWRVEVPGGAERGFVVTRKPGATGLNRVLAIFPLNLPGSDSQVLAIEEGDVAPPPTATATVPPTDLPPTVPPTQPPSATPTRPEPTPKPEGHRILLPALLRGAALGAP